MPSDFDLAEELRRSLAGEEEPEEEIEDPFFDLDFDRPPAPGELDIGVDPERDIGPLIGFATKALDSLLRPVTRSVMGAVEVGERALSDIRGTEREPRDIQGLLTPIIGTEIDPDRFTRAGEQGAVAGEIVGVGFPIAAGGRLLLQSQSARILDPAFRLFRRKIDPSRIQHNIQMDSARLLGGTGAKTPSVAGVPTKIVRDMTKSLRDDPVGFMAVERSSILGAAQVGTLGDALFPGQVGPRITGEVIGSFVSPLSLATRTVTHLAPGAKALLSKMGEAGKYEAAAEAIRRGIIAAGEDPQEVIKALGRADLVDLPGISAGQKTGSRGLLAFEKQAAIKSQKFAGIREEKTREGFTTLREMADRLAATGNPNDLRIAAELRKVHFEDILGQRFAEAQQEAAIATARLMPRGLSPDDADPALLRNIQAEASENAANIIRRSVQDARGVESQYWSAAISELDISLPPSSRVGNLLQDMMRALADPGALSVPELSQLEAISSGTHTALNLHTTRSKLLAIARRKDLDSEEAGTARRFANALLEDLLAVNVPEYELARTYSNSLNETFTRTFARQASGAATDARGVSRLDPEDILEMAIRPKSGTQAARRLNELADVGDFLDGMYGIPTGIRAAIVGEQELFLRASVAELVDPDTGRITGKSLRSYRERHANVLEEFPVLSEQLKSAASANRFLEQIIESNQVISRAQAQKLTWMRLLDKDAIPEQVIREATQSPNFSQAFRSLSSVARLSGDDAVAGMRAAVLDDLYTRSSRGNPQQLWTRFERLWSEPVRRGQPSMREISIREGIFTTPQANTLDKIIRTGKQIEVALLDPRRIDKILEDPTALSQMAASMIGTRIGVTAGKTLGIIGPGESGPSLVVAARGASMFRDFANNTPLTRKAEVIKELLENPEMLRVSLKTLDKPATIKAVHRQLNAALIGAGIPPSVFEEQTHQQILQEEGELPPMFDDPLDTDEEAFMQLEDIMRGTGAHF